MIPITDSTTLSIEKTAKLIQSLVDLKDKNVELPWKLAKCVDDVLDTQQTLLKEIDDLLHDHNEAKDNEDRLEILKTIVEPNPEFLATKDEYGRIPCAVEICRETKPSFSALKLYAEVGYKHNVGGEGKRGGILVPDNYYFTALQHIETVEPLKVLQETTPPLFFIEDVQKHTLFHAAVFSGNTDLVKYFISLDPSFVYMKDRDGNFPLQYVERHLKDENMYDLLQYLLQTIFSQSPTSNETIGGLFGINPLSNDKLIISCMVDNMGMEKAWDCIERTLSKQKELNNLPCILHNIIQHTPDYFSEVIKRFPESVHVRDKNNNRLPIHIALEKGMEWSIELAYLLNASQEYLKDVDPVTNWPPFVLAGMGESCNLRIVYDLLRKHPEHVEKSGDGKYVWERRGLNHIKRK